jgi:hypothetical protein
LYEKTFLGQKDMQSSSKVIMLAYSISFTPKALDHNAQETIIEKLITHGH